MARVRDDGETHECLVMRAVSELIANGLDRLAGSTGVSSPAGRRAVRRGNRCCQLGLDPSGEVRIALGPLLQQKQRKYAVIGSAGVDRHAGTCVSPQESKVVGISAALHSSV
jgi:hypothetical protein